VGTVEWSLVARLQGNLSAAHANLNYLRIIK
jgi:hypothetical protein